MSLPSTDGPSLSLRGALDQECPLQIVGAINAYCALLAQNAGFRAIYLSGAGIANASHGLPDLGLTNMADVVEDARRITSVTRLPLLVDIDTGWGNALTINRAVRELGRVGVAGVHLEDQIDAKRCGHRPGKTLVAPAEMANRIKAAVDARMTPDMVMMARTDAAASEGLERAIERANLYVEAGADMLFAEAIRSLDEYQRFTSQVDVPVLANITEFGKTPLFSVAQLKAAGVQLVLYPLTAFRAMNAAAEHSFRVLREQGTQASIVDQLQTRERLYEILDYESWERRQDMLKSND